MPRCGPTEPITVRADKEVVGGIDALAADEGRVSSAEDVFSTIASRHGWPR
jgi:hypothetical protein